MGYEAFEFLDVSPMPRPFPGKYPTRVRLVSGDGNVVFSYVGKPIGLKEMVSRRYLAWEGRLDRLHLTEFDQNGIVRQLSGGNFSKVAAFANIYFPFPSFYYANLSRLERWFVCLDRTLENIGERRMYRNTFWEGGPSARRFLAMQRDCVRNHVARTWFTPHDENEVGMALDRSASNWFHSTRRRPPTAEVPIEAAAAPTPPPAWGDWQVLPPTGRMPMTIDTRVTPLTRIPRRLPTTAEALQMDEQQQIYANNLAQFTREPAPQTTTAPAWPPTQATIAHWTDTLRANFTATHP